MGRWALGGVVTVAPEDGAREQVAPGLRLGDGGLLPLAAGNGGFGIRAFAHVIVAAFGA